MFLGSDVIFKESHVLVVSKKIESSTLCLFYIFRAFFGHPLYVSFATPCIPLEPDLRSEVGADNCAICCSANKSTSRILHHCELCAFGTFLRLCVRSFDGKVPNRSRRDQVNVGRTYPYYVSSC